MQTNTLWIGSAAPFNSQQLILGSEHPAQAGAISLTVNTEETVIRDCTVRIGYTHRGVEKLFEVRDYRQCLGLADRHDWQSPIIGELSITLAIETSLGISAPDRAVWLRTLAVEHARIHTLLGMLTWTAKHNEEIYNSLSLLRERMRQSLSLWTGSRLHPMLCRIGGVQYDVNDSWLAAEAKLANDIMSTIETIAPLLELPYLTGSGVITRSTIDSYGLSGPIARASGLERDSRNYPNNLMYQELPQLPKGETFGDVPARFRQLAAETIHSANLVIECTSRLANNPGAISVRLPKVLRVPEGDYYVPLEAPFGEAGIRIVSRGEKTPWRVFLRTPSQQNVLALEQILLNQDVSNIEAIVASVGWVSGDVDK
ncbi:MAG: hypothetical protein ACRDAX_08090 [Propionibacteriaceae bacterium]